MTKETEKNNLSKAEVERLIENTERRLGRRFNLELDRIRERINKLEERAYFVQGNPKRLKLNQEKKK